MFLKRPRLARARRPRKGKDDDGRKGKNKAGGWKGKNKGVLTEGKGTGKGKGHHERSIDERHKIITQYMQPYCREATVQRYAQRSNLLTAFMRSRKKACRLQRASKDAEGALFEQQRAAVQRWVDDEDTLCGVEEVD